MKIAVLTNEDLRAELLSNGVQSELEIVYVDSVSDFLKEDADAYLDFLFKNEKQRMETLQKLLPKLVIINSVKDTLQETNSSFIRINAWPTFLKSSLIEASAAEEKREEAEKIFSFFNKKLEWLPDEVGFITPRVISMIINEAFFSLEEKLSSKEEIDTAMKLGTNYPFGPFEWADKIGKEKIVQLLKKLSRHQKRYEPAPLLLKSISE